MADLKTARELGPDYEQIVADLLATGDYATEADILRDGLKLLSEQREQVASRVEALHAAIAEGDASGVAEPFDFEEFLSDLRAEHDAQPKS